MSFIRATLFVSLCLTYLLESNYVFMSMSEIFQIFIFFVYYMSTKTLLYTASFNQTSTYRSRNKNVHHKHPWSLSFQLS